MDQSQRLAGGITEADSRGNGEAQHVADARHLRWRDGAKPGASQQSTTCGCCGEWWCNVHDEQRTWPSDESWWATEPDVGRVANGVANRVDRLRCVGNGQVPAVVRIAWEILQ
jgi:hypothetical protein